MAMRHWPRTRLNAGLLALLPHFLLGEVWAQIKVLAPRDLTQQFSESSGVIWGATATFGAPYYGERVYGRLLYGESKGGHDHCTQDDYDLPDLTSAQEHMGEKLVNVAVVRRGQCTFVQKVRVAQEKKAHAVIMIDKHNSMKNSEDIQRVVMADDGFGSTVRIPSVLISNTDGNKLLDALKKSPVIVELAWDIPHAEVVLADFWMSSGEQDSSEFLERFKEPAETLKFHLQFVPHYHVFSLPPGSNFGGLCTDTATSKHCAPDPDGPGPITGAMVVDEDLRQLCLWHTTKVENPLVDPSEVGATYSQAFWEYVTQLRTACPLNGKDQDHRFGRSCSLRLMTKLSIDSEKVLACVARNADKFLDKEVEDVAWSPQALRLNGYRYSGPLDKDTVVKAICSGFQEQPPECRALLSGRTQYLAKMFSGGSLVGGISTMTMLGAIAVLISFMGIGFHLYRRQMTKSVRQVLREEVMLEVQSQMADYSALEDTDSIKGRPLSF